MLADEVKCFGYYLKASSDVGNDACQRSRVNQRAMECCIPDVTSVLKRGAPRCNPPPFDILTLEKFGTSNRIRHTLSHAM